MSREHHPAGFEVVSMTEAELGVTESSRRGAPMTLIRGGEERDLAAIAAMGRIRADPFRFHLDRDVDFVQHAITKTRLRAGLGPAGARQPQLFMPSTDVLTVRSLGSTAVQPGLSGDDVLYWRGDIF